MIEEFGIEGVVTFEPGQGGLATVKVSSPLADATIYLQGAHVTHWQLKGEKPVLAMSSKSKFAAGEPIRGGIPVCFPWFANREGGLPGPSHGFARIQEWKVEHVAMDSDGRVDIVFTLGPTGMSREYGFSSFAAAYRVTVGKELSVELMARNTGNEPMHITEALHTYFAVSNVREIAIDGLDGATYSDKRDDNKRKLQEGVLRITRDTDRVHFNTTKTCTLEDPAWERRILVEKHGSNSTVVWNPGPELSKTFVDLGPDDWPHFVCIEAANALDDGYTLAAGEAHALKCTLRIEK